MAYELVDLSAVWVLADVYEAQLRFVAPGVATRLELNAFPGRTDTGAVQLVDPVLDEKTRTAKVRIAFDNPDGALRPGMFGAVTLERPQRAVVRVPADALVRSGLEAYVFVARGAGRFEPRRVKAGEVGREYAEVLDGVSEGEQVVTKANFFVDSESQLRASLARLSGARGTR
jgi:Cu(I)/Ag(I) efflux system membrane fusion protein